MNRATVRTAIIAVVGLAFVGGIAALALSGCVDRPRAPALVTEAVYENSDLGLHFIVPDGWIVSGRSTAPVETKFTKPQRFVRYQAPGDASTALELYCVDLPPGQELIGYLSEGRNQIGSERWVSKIEPAKETIDGVPCTRYTFTEVKKANRRRDIVAFERGASRYYLFLVTYNAGSSGRQQAGRSLDSVRWK